MSTAILATPLFRLRVLANCLLEPEPGALRTVSTRGQLQGQAVWILKVDSIGLEAADQILAPQLGRRLLLIIVIDRTAVVRQARRAALEQGHELIAALG